jgi:hypothetical protein
MLLYCDSTGGRGAAFITIIIVVDNNNGEFVNFQFSTTFLEFSLEKSISGVDLDVADGKVTPYRVESIGKRWSNEADTTIDR